MLQMEHVLAPKGREFDPPDTIWGMERGSNLLPSSGGLCVADFWRPKKEAIFAFFASFCPEFNTHIRRFLTIWGMQERSFITADKGNQSETTMDKGPPGQIWL